jgi:DNA replication protein DnaC
MDGRSMEHQYDNDNVEMYRNNAATSGWHKPLPSTTDKTPLEEIGVVHQGMTGKEVYEASKAYWKDYYQNRAKKRKVVTLNRTKPWANGCKCDGAGWYMLDVDPMDFRYRQLQRCSCNGAGQSFRHALQAFAEDTFDTFDVDRKLAPFNAGGVSIAVDMQKRMLTKAYNTLANDDISNGKSYYLWGLVGCGKSHLARAWGIRFAEMGYSVEYRAILNLVGELMGAIKDKRVEQVINALINAEILIIDDIGAESEQSDFIRSCILRIIDGRMKKKTLYTSNVDPVDLHTVMDERIADRINQSTRLWLPLQSYRQLLRKD